MRRRGVLTICVVPDPEEERRKAAVMSLAGSQSLARTLTSRCKALERSFSKAGRTSLVIVLRMSDMVCALCFVKVVCVYSDRNADGNAIVVGEYFVLLYFMRRNNRALFEWRVCSLAILLGWFAAVFRFGESESKRSFWDGAKMSHPTNLHDSRHM